MRRRVAWPGVAGKTAKGRQYYYWKRTTPWTALPDPARDPDGFIRKLAHLQRLDDDHAVGGVGRLGDVDLEVARETRGEVLAVVVGGIDLGDVLIREVDDPEPILQRLSDDLARSPALLEFQHVKVALGVDRLLMAMLGTSRIADVLAFDFARA